MLFTELPTFEVVFYDGTGRVLGVVGVRAPTLQALFSQAEEQYPDLYNKAESVAPAYPSQFQ